MQEVATFPRPRKTMTDTTTTPSAAAKAEFAGEDRIISLPILVVLAFLIGIVAALGAVFFRYMIAVIHNILFLGKFSFLYDANVFDPPTPWGPFVILVPVIGGLIVVWLVQTFAPEAKGHGVPEVMFAIYHNKGNVRGIVAVIKSFASALSIGTGASVGREGPIIQIGASFGSTLARKLHLARWQKITHDRRRGRGGHRRHLQHAARRRAVRGRAAAARAVEPHLPAGGGGDHHGDLAGALCLWAFARLLRAGGGACRRLLPSPLRWCWPASACSGLPPVSPPGRFIQFLAWCEDIFPKLPGNAYTQNIVGMLIIGVLFYAFMLTTGHGQTDGVGYATIQSVLEGGTVGLVLLGLLFVAKIFATSISLGSGASGGIFSPSLFIGATLGGAFGTLGAFLFPHSGFSVVEFAVVGMGAIVGGATGASMTAIVMIFEMTRDYNVIVPLVLAVALATGTRRALIKENIYTIKLRHRGRPIPVNRHTNMYLVRQARELMNKDFIVLPIATSIADALTKIAERPGAHIIVSDGPRIAGVARLTAGSYTPDRYAGQTLESITADNFVISQETAILNTVISRMNRRNRNFCIVVSDRVRIPRAEDVVGVIAANEIANAVISNHYA